MKLHALLLSRLLSITFPGVITAASMQFNCPATQKSFDAILGTDEIISSGVVAVTNFAHVDLIREIKVGAHKNKEGSIVSLDPGSNLAVFDCANLPVTSRDVEVAVGLSDVLVCELSFRDLLGSVDSLPSLQSVMESVAWGSSTKKKHLFIVCEDCDSDNSRAAADAAQSLVVRTWNAAVKPFSSEHIAVGEQFHVHPVVLPHPKRAPAEFSAQVSSLKAAVFAASAPIAPNEIQTGMTSAASNSRVFSVGSRAFADEDALANVASDSCLEAAFGEFVEGLQDLTAELSGNFDAFGDICNEAVDQTLGTFDALTSGIDVTAKNDAKRAELERRVFGELQPVYRSQLKELDELAWGRLRSSLAKLRVGPSLLKEMEVGVQDAEAFFRDTALSMQCRGASWSADLERREMAAKMRRFVTERLQAARQQGTYVPGMLRRPVAVSLHYLATHPFSMLDALQDRLSYEEDMEWAPQVGMKDADGKATMLSKLPKDLSSASKKLSARAEH